ncbi:unknown protein [Simkania negevensis Z]|uniref:Uncharacterized protein n=1 Tax=Simkania negevensis (strain ATCC VR-1471 / DSM 27360 / Z) TaxID=331113 RepID=F8L8B8_SIMNZ|nr:unknown protein [Simkania negevensis Z]
MFEYNLIQILPEFFSPKIKHIVHKTRVNFLLLSTDIDFLEKNVIMEFKIMTRGKIS